MAKCFKHRIYRVITATFNTCRSKHPSLLPQNPVPSSTLLSTSLNPVASARTGLPPPPDSTRSQELKRQKKEENLHLVVANIHKTRRKICSSASEDHPSPPSASRRGRNNTKKKKVRNNVPSRLRRLSTSSADSGWFSSDGAAAAVDDEEETETLVSSSLSISTDSSVEINPRPQILQPIGETQTFTTTNPPRIRRNRKRRAPKPKRTKRCVFRHPAPPPPEPEVPARLSVFKKLIPCTVDGKVKESFAVVKRSSDPYEDFKNSMMDMILEKQMFDRSDLEQLLECFLSLNSRCYHGIIVQAFSEIWEMVFSGSGSDKFSGQDRRRVSRLASV